MDSKKSTMVADKFAECWLARYPRQLSCCHDNGGEFTGWEFQKLLADFAIKDEPTTSHNPGVNGVCEWMHKQIGDVI